MRLDDNKKMIEASEILAEVKIPLTVNNIIGFPYETRDLVFDTIELNRQFGQAKILIRW